MNKFGEEWKDKKVLIFGLGKQGGGTGDLNWLKSHGTIVRASDVNLELVPEGQTKEQVDWAEIIIKNPGVPDNHRLLNYAKSKGTPVLTSIALFVKYCGIKTIGVTGTRGKSTTVALITALLNKAFPGQVIAGGNIAGTSCLSLFDQLEGKNFAVLELSSFQLHNFHELKVSPNIAVITNLYPDHLNRYNSMQDYQHDKEAIVRYQRSSDITLFNRDNSGAIAIARAATGQSCWYSASLVDQWETSLPGKHNRENLAAMVGVAQILGISTTICKQVVKDFQGIPFRQEKIAVIAGVTYINDTTATTPIAALKALQAASSPFIWITGGDTKNLPFEELLQEVKVNPRLKGVVILGSKNIPAYTNELTSVVGDKILGWATSMPEAVRLATQSAQTGDTILLSPGFASFDLFQNEFDRGRQFNDCVKTV
ncbi:MAG: UDP-N-acetylmuramoyl-L-alanine--D-glutamate ligase [bacterium]